MNPATQASWLKKKLLLIQLFGYVVTQFWDILSRPAKRFSIHHSRTQKRKLSATEFESEGKSGVIVVIGGSFSGYYAASLIASTLPPDSLYRIIVIEPNSHFHFTWVLPRFCVVSDHEHKAFIPHGPFLAKYKNIRWIQDRAVGIDGNSVSLKDSGDIVHYDFLIIATGSDGGGGLPSRVGTEEKTAGMKLVREVQKRIAESQKIVIVGGGAVGVEVATDAKDKYPEKEIVLVHSRQAVMHRFGPELQDTALKALEALGVEVILGERVSSEDIDAGIVTLASGRTIACDFLVRCGGQKPASQILYELSPSCVSDSGHIRVKPTMQLMDEKFPNVYACGDVADTGVHNPNSRAAMSQAKIAADNIVLAALGKHPSYIYKHHWAESVIKLTLGLDKSVLHFEHNQTELLFHAKEKKIELMVGQAWGHWGVKPFEDTDYKEGFLNECADNLEPAKKNLIL